MTQKKKPDLLNYLGQDRTTTQIALTLNNDIVTWFWIGNHDDYKQFLLKAIALSTIGAIA